MSDPSSVPGFVWLDLTRKCQLACRHCHNRSGPEGTHGTMTGEDWTRVLGEIAAVGIGRVQFTGGEVTLYPGAPALVEYALALGLRVEVYSNLVHVTEDWWGLLRRDGVGLATSYYGPAERHDAVTRRPSHARTRSNIVRAVEYGIPLRASVIVPGPADTGDDARRELTALGVKGVRVDRVRPFGRAAGGREPCADGLCGRCGDGRASVAPDGTVSPCVFSTWMGVGNVRDTPLGAVLGGPEMARANAVIRQRRSPGVPYGHDPCGPDDDSGGGDESECSPGYPGSSCSPRN
ncbi:radical SAM/SPASM domain-containing protein [Streptomyces niveiscabiei]|uniref:radical SAM/SPASM domain-containing protein n=1 Tax=Streptomyces niveiscabiei TaxID=164115 RepID=UPI0006EBAEA9|nr:radical SAM/SPASM domain-containing protein [Streptomyces niveiscabiei]